MTARDGEAGFTLVEVLVALAIFAVIGAAGFAVLDQVLRVQRQTDGRLERLAEIQRSMHLVSLDFLQAEGGSLEFADGAVALRRIAGGENLAVLYRLEEGALIRRLSQDLGGGTGRQVLLSRVADIAWRFYRDDTGWIEAWPPPGEAAPVGNPAAIELSATLQPPGLAGVLRRVAILPAEARR